MYTNMQSIATALLDGGWTSEDAEEIQREYGFSGEELEQVIECMRGYEPRYAVICMSDDGDTHTKTFDDYDDARECYHSMCARAITRMARVYDTDAGENIHCYDREEVARMPFTYHKVKVTSRYWRADAYQIVDVPDVFEPGSEQEWYCIRYHCGIRGRRENYTVTPVEE